MSDLFAADAAQQAQPLAARLRPAHLDDYVGQQHLVGEGKPLRQALDRGQLHSMILWGPPGTGKTTVTGQVIAQLVAAGQRVAISSNSHPAINNLLRKAKSTCTAAGVASEVVKCSNAKEDPLAAEGFTVVRPDQLS